MGRFALALIMLLSVSIWAQDALQGIRDFFQREGYVVKVEGNRALVDLGRDRVRSGEEFTVFREGKEIVHPVTKQVIGRERERVGRLRIEEVQEAFSYARILEGSAREGDRIRLWAEDVCFDGSEDWFFKLRSVLPELKREKTCTYTIKELKEGIGVEYRGAPVAFFQVQQAAPVGIERAGLEDINLLARPKLLRPLPSLPLSADLCDLTGTGKEFLAVLFSGRVEVYELLKNDLVKRFEYSLPAGVPVGLQCGKITGEGTDLVLVNMVTGDSANSIILRAVGDSFVPVRRNIPYIMGVLDRRRPRETFVGQRFNFRDRFGQTVRLSLEGENLRETGAFLAPRGFRIDSAFYFGDYLVFTDTAGRVRVFRGDSEVFSTEEGFGGSYTLVEIPFEQGKLNFIFNPKGASVRFLNFNMALVVKNHTGVVQRFLDIVKYSRGELFILGERRKDLVFIRPVRGGNFEESVQAVLTTKDGRILVLTGRTGTLTIQNRGEVYELELRAL
ncbi:MAG: hypothetical protein WHS43_00025 [Aquificaceae bacterium]|jgi:hypothetical protein|uniref:hypothetical protein n=1 Tax=Hydrogenobacter sp. Uz 6-8 TaxID=3384828 RepID=UPI000F1AB824|nr:MAG: hypothetical protein D6804_07315 [Aquificota bacterium]